MAKEKYSIYKNSTVSWLGEIPEHWEIRRIKYVFKELDSRSETGKEDLLSVSQYTGVTKKSDKVAEGESVSNAKTLEGYKIVEKGDLVINIMLAWNGSLGISKYKGIVSPAYCVYRNLIGNERYFGYLFKTKKAQQEFKKQSTGIIDSRLRMYTDSFFDIKTALPPIEEQTTIANFLDYKTEQIEYFIKKKKRLLELSIERRKSLTKNITQSNNVKFLRISRVAPLIHRAIEREVNEIYIPVGLYNRGRGIFHKPETLGKDLGDSTFYRIKEGDVILSGQFAWEGSVALAKKSDEGCIASHRYPILKCDEDYIIPEFLFSFFTISEGHFFLEINSVGAAGRNRPLNPRKLIKEKIPVPSLEEQLELIEIIKKEDSLKKLIEKEIALVEEYKTALIAEVVTGKIDIRDFKVPTQETPLAMVAEEAANYNKR